MKNLLLLSSLAAVTLSLNSCCSMFSMQKASTKTETKSVLVGYQTVQEAVPGSRSGKDGMVKYTNKEVPVYEQQAVTSRDTQYCGPSLYCAKKNCGGSTADSTLKMASAQGDVGSPNIGLMPTMKTLAP
jgi:hypothetical protein